MHSLLYSTVILFHNTNCLLLHTNPASCSTLLFISTEITLRCQKHIPLYMYFHQFCRTSKQTVFLKFSILLERILRYFRNSSAGLKTGARDHCVQMLEFHVCHTARKRTIMSKIVKVISVTAISEKITPAGRGAEYCDQPVCMCVRP